VAEVARTAKATEVAEEASAQQEQMQCFREQGMREGQAGLQTETISSCQSWVAQAEVAEAETREETDVKVEAEEAEAEP
jgi:malate synthase